MRSVKSGFFLSCAAGGLAALLLASPAPAQDSGGQMTGLKLSGNLPIQIESDKLEVHQNDSIAIFSGNVSVTQGTTLMKAGKMTVYYVKEEDKGGAASGSGAAAAASSGATSIDHLEVEDKVYLKSEDQVATGDRGTFDMKTEVLVLLGKEVVLSQGANVLVGCKLTVQMRTGLSQVDGCGGGSGKNGRVMMSITPDTVKNR